MAFNEGKGVEPALTYCVNPEVLQQFVEFMMKNQGIKAITCSRYVSPLISACKVPLLCSQDEQKKRPLKKLGSFGGNLNDCPDRKKLIPTFLIFRQKK